MFTIASLVNFEIQAVRVPQEFDEAPNVNVRDSFVATSVTISVISQELNSRF